MVTIDKRKVPLKYVLGFTVLKPSPMDLLYETVSFLYNEHKDEFTESDLKTKTKSRVGTLEENIQYLLENGYIEKGKYSRYSININPWE